MLLGKNARLLEDVLFKPNPKRRLRSLVSQRIAVNPIRRNGLEKLTVKRKNRFSSQAYLAQLIMVRYPKLMSHWRKEDMYDLQS